MKPTGQRRRPAGATHWRAADVASGRRPARPRRRRAAGAPRPDTVDAVQRIAVVTGASSGIGEATARALTARGWYCILVARREERLRALADEIGGEVELCDVGGREEVEALAARVLERHPAIHLLVNNAGMPARGTLPGRPRPDRECRPGQLPRRRLVTRALMPGLQAAAAAGGAHIVNMLPWPAPSRSHRQVDTRRRSMPSSRSRARCPQPSAAAASPCTRSCPGSSRRRGSRRRRSSRAG